MQTTVPTSVVSTKKSTLTSPHVTAYNWLAAQASAQTLAQVATGLGLDQDTTEKQLSILVDEAIVKRTVGSRTTAVYSLV